MIGAIIQARLRSTRLPGKVMLHWRGKPILQHVIERVRLANCTERIVVTVPYGSPLVSFVKELGALVSEGPEDNLCERYIRAANEHDIKTIVRITADCPMIEPNAIQEAVALHAAVDYVHVGPDGTDVQVFDYSMLVRNQEDRDHVCGYMKNGSYSETMFPFNGHSIDTIDDYIKLCEKEMVMET